jgi:hypothetical protein
VGPSKGQRYFEVRVWVVCECECECVCVCVCCGLIVHLFGVAVDMYLWMLKLQMTDQLSGACRRSPPVQAAGR